MLGFFNFLKMLNATKTARIKTHKPDSLAWARILAVIFSTNEKLKLTYKLCLVRQ